MGNKEIKAFACKIGKLWIAIKMKNNLISEVRFSFSREKLKEIIGTFEEKCVPEHEIVKKLWLGKVRFGDVKEMFDLSQLSPSQKKVYLALRNIPLGKTISYKCLSKITGLPPITVGYLLSKNPFELVFPCHRVVGKRNKYAFRGKEYDEDKKLILHLEKALSSSKDIELDS